MLKEIKKLILKDVEEQLEDYQNAINRIDQITEEVNNIDVYIQSSIEYPTLKNVSFSLLDRLFFKRKEYKENSKYNKEALAKRDEDIKQLDKNKDDLRKRKEQIVEERNTLVESLDKYKYFIDEKKRIMAMKSIKEMGLSFTDAINILRDANIPLVLDEDDKYITQNESSFDDEKDFILVHKTAYSPANDRIIPTGAAGAIYTEVYSPDGFPKFTYSYAEPRNTVHFCLNGEVSSHAEGNFDGRKYGVLVPFDKASHDNIVAFKGEDTFFEGSVDISKGYILCPESEMDKVELDNPNTIVVGYKGESVDGYADAFLSTIGYKQEDVTPWSWKNKNDDNLLYMFYQNHEDELKSFDNHYYTQSKNKEDAIRAYNELFGFIEGFSKYLDANNDIDVDAFIISLVKNRDIPSINAVVHLFTVYDKSISYIDYIENILTKLKTDYNVIIDDQLKSLIISNNPNDRVFSGLSYELEKHMEYVSKDNREFLESYPNKYSQKEINTLFMRSIFSQIKEQKLTNSDNLSR